MNVNADKGQLIKLHRLYNFCLKEKLNDWLKEQTPSQEAEWCATEKKVYLDHMRLHVPVEYDNIMRLE
jgi:hypothetical protein